jgi:hypothetical protein
MGEATELAPKASVETSVAVFIFNITGETVYEIVDSIC